MILSFGEVEIMRCGNTLCVGNRECAIEGVEGRQSVAKISRWNERHIET